MAKFLGKDKRYEILESIGQGSFSVVYKALDRKLSRTVAVKVLIESTSETSLKRLQRELDVCFRLRHDNIITVYDAELDGRHKFIVMEYVHAGDVEELLTLEVPSIEKSCKILHDVALALEYLHGMGLFHRDIKPANVLVLKGPRAKLMDFNLVFDEDATALTRTGLVLGTPLYMAPELWLGSLYSEKSDIYALGVLAYNLLSGNLSLPLTKGETFRPRDSPFPAPSTRNPDVPEYLDRLVAWATQPMPDDRCPGAVEFIAALEAKGCVEATNTETGRLENNNETDTGTLVPITSSESTASLHRKRGLLQFIMLLCLFSLIVLFPRPRPRTKHKSDAVVARVTHTIDLCRIHDGLVFTIKGSLTASSRWMLFRDGQRILDKKLCFRHGRWTGECFGLSGNGKYLLKVIDRRGEQLTKVFRLPANDFEKAPLAWVEEDKVRLQWSLHGRARLSLKVKNKCGTELITLEKDCTRTTISGMDCVSLSYSILLRDRVLASADIDLGCANRLDKNRFPDGMMQMPSRPPIAVGRQILVIQNFSNLLCYEYSRTAAGPRLDMLWLLKFAGGRRALAVFDDKNSGCVVLQVYPKVSMLRLNLEKRHDLLKQPDGASIEGEWRVSPQLRPSRTRVGACALDGGVFLMSKERKGLLKSCLVTFDGKLVKGPDIRGRGRFIARSLGDRAAVLCSAGGVCYLTIVHYDRERRILTTLMNDVRVLETRQEWRMKLLPKASLLIASGMTGIKVLGNKREITVLDLAALRNGNIVIRLGPIVGMVDRELAPIGSPVTLPGVVIQRTSTPMTLTPSTAAFLLVDSNDTLPPITEARVAYIDFSARTGKRLRFVPIHGVSGQMGREVRCSGGFSRGRYWFVPALENIYVFDKSTLRLKRSIFCRFRPLHSLFVEDTLFAFTRDRLIRGIDPFNLDKR